MDEPTATRRSALTTLAMGTSVGLATVLPGGDVLQARVPQTGEVVSPRDFGLVGSATQDATGQMQAMFDEIPDGSIVDFDAGLLDGSGGDYRITDTLVVSKQISLCGRGSRIFGAMRDSDTDLIRYEPKTDMRGVLIQGLRLGFSSGGRDALSFNGGSVGVIGNVVWRCSINGGAGGYAVRMSGAGNHFNVIRDCTLFGMSTRTGAVSLEGADGTTVADCVIHGIGCGVRIHTIAGAYKTGIFGGAIRSRDMGVHVTTGQQIDIERVQFEQGTGNSDGDRNQARLKSHIVIEGEGSYPQGEEVRDARIIGCNFGGGVNQDTAISLVRNARDIIIDENYFANIGGRELDIAILEPSVRWTRIGPNNRVGGPRNGMARGAANAIDPKDLFFVSDNGTGTYGAYQAAAALRLVNGWTAQAGFAFWKDAGDYLRFRSTLSAGGATPGTTIGVLPDGFRPATSQRIAVPTDTDDIAILAIAPTGEMTVRSARADAVLFMDQVTVPVKGRSSYLSGPY